MKLIFCIIGLIVCGCAVTRQKADHESTTYVLNKDGTTNSIVAVKGHAQSSAMAGGDAKNIIDKMRASSGKTSSVGATGVNEETSSGGIVTNGASAMMYLMTH